MCAGMLLAVALKGLPMAIKLYSAALLVVGTPGEIRKRAERLIVKLEEAAQAEGKDRIDCNEAIRAIRAYLKIIDANGGPVTDQMFSLAE